MNVGDEIETSCPRCKLILNHVILYFGADGRIRGVECRTCGLRHVYRAHALAKVRKPPPSPKTLKALVQGGPFQERLSLVDEERIIPYRMDGRFGVDDAIRHPRFGVGFVLRVGQGRIEVLFREGVKLLIASVAPAP